MAVNYPAPNYNQTSNQVPFYTAQQQQQQQQQHSPADSAPPTPHNLSPTSPRMDTFLKYQLPNHVRQLRPPKSPLYVPAVLRPTERPVRQPPMTPPKSLHSSLNSLEEADFDGRMGGDGAPPLHLVFPEEPLGEVTGPPTKDYWKPDEASPSCDSPKCRSSFNLFVRKHHCRHCGHIFCSEHTAYTIPLDQHAKFHPEGIVSRACDSCYKQYQKWEIARTLRRKTSESGTPHGEASVLPLAGLDRKAVDRSNEHPQLIGAKPSDTVASSVPRDWAWSTF